VPGNGGNSVDVAPTNDSGHTGAAANGVVFVRCPGTCVISTTPESASLPSFGVKPAKPAKGGISFSFSFSTLELEFPEFESAKGDAASFVALELLELELFAGLEPAVFAPTTDAPVVATTTKPTRPTRPTRPEKCVSVNVSTSTRTSVAALTKPAN
jgi:hypothetical protein